MTLSALVCSMTRSSEVGEHQSQKASPIPDPVRSLYLKIFFKRGFGVPVHPFLQGLCIYYEIGICNLHPNSILLVSMFIHLCEAFGGFLPHFDLFRYLFYLRKKGSRGVRRLLTGCT
jgi:hypothetical protein